MIKGGGGGGKDNIVLVEGARIISHDIEVAHNVNDFCNFIKYK